MDGILHLIVGCAAATMQHQGSFANRCDLIQPVDPQGRCLLVHTVGGADGYRKGIHIGDLHKSCNLLRNSQALAGIGIRAGFAD